MNNFKLATCVKKDTLNQKYHQFDFKSDVPLNIEPGQYINIRVGTNIIRGYSVAIKNGDHDFSLLVEIDPNHQGPGTSFFKNLKEGDKILYVGPFGQFIFKKNEDYSSFIFLATGSGISPIRRMIDFALIEQNIKKPVFLYFGLRNEKDIFWHDYWLELQHKFPNFKYKLTLSQPSDSWKGYKGYITDLVKNDFVSAQDCAAYVCGGKEAVLSCVDLLINLKCPKENIHTERFN